MEQKPARARIIDAAHRLMLTIGLTRATTKEIAKAAGCSEPRSTSTSRARKSSSWWS